MPTPAPQLVLAPMRGVTTMHYRQAFVHHFRGLDAEMAPFIPTVAAERIKPSLLKDVLPESRSGLPLVPQLIGNRAEDFVLMTRALHDLGYDEVDWNLGCPHKPIRKKQRGAGLLPHPERVDTFLEHVCAQSPCRISVKVRLGVTDHTELLRLAPVLNQYPLSEVIVHPRTAEQMYTGHVDLDAFEQVLAVLAAPVCYNGDLASATFFAHVRARFPQLDRFMLGRGLLTDPFLCESIKQITPPSANGPIARLTAFHDDLLERYETVLHGDHSILGRMKEFWTYLCGPLSNGEALFKKLKKTERLSTYRAVIAQFLADATWTAPYITPAPHAAPPCPVRKPEF